MELKMFIINFKIVPNYWCSTNNDYTIPASFTAYIRTVFQCLIHNFKSSCNVQAAASALPFVSSSKHIFL